MAAEAGLKPEVEDSGVTLPLRAAAQPDRPRVPHASRARASATRWSVQGSKLMFRPRKTAQKAIADAASRSGADRVPPAPVDPRPGVRGRGAWLGSGAPSARSSAAPAVGEESPLMGGSTSGPAERAARLRHARERARRRARAQPGGSRPAGRRGFAEMALRYMCAEGLCIGEPRLRAGKVVEIEGLGRALQRAVLPHLRRAPVRPARQGYRTMFSARRNAT